MHVGLRSPHAVDQYSVRSVLYADEIRYSISMPPALSVAQISAIARGTRARDSARARHLLLGSMLSKKSRKYNIYMIPKMYKRKEYGMIQGQEV